MKTFLARALDLEGSSVEQCLTAASSQEAFEVLEARGLMSIRLREIDEEEAARLRESLPAPLSPAATRMLATLEEVVVHRKPALPEKTPTLLAVPEEVPRPPSAAPGELWMAAAQRREEAARRAAVRREKAIDPRRRRMPDVDRIAFFHGLSGMLTAGIPLLRAVSLLREQFSHPVSRASMAALARATIEGKPLSAAMAELPRTFQRLQVGSVLGAERSGRLPGVLSRLHRHEERSLWLTRQVQGHLTYPTLVFACALTLILFVGRSLLSGMIPVLDQARVPMGATTEAVLGLARALDHPLAGLAVLIGLAGGGIRLARWLRTARGQESRDRLLMRTPIVRTLLRRVETSRACESVATLYGSGLPLLQCIEVAGGACDNVVSRAAMSAIAIELKRGRTLSEAMTSTGYFDRTVSQLAHVGEISGQLEMAFGKIAQYNDLAVQTALEAFAAAIEPVMLLVLGVVVGAIALVAFAPLYQLMGSLG